MNEEKSQDTTDSLSRQIVDVLHKELGDKCGRNRNFPEAMWVAIDLDPPSPDSFCILS